MSDVEKGFQVRLSSALIHSDTCNSYPTDLSSLFSFFFFIFRRCNLVIVRPQRVLFSQTPTWIRTSDATFQCRRYASNSFTFSFSCMGLTAIKLCAGYALLDFVSNAAVGESGLEDWNSSHTTPCHWTGIQCSNEFYVLVMWAPLHPFLLDGGPAHCAQCYESRTLEHSQISGRSKLISTLIPNHKV